MNLLRVLEEVQEGKGSPNIHGAFLPVVSLRVLVTLLP